MQDLLLKFYGLVEEHLPYIPGHRTAGEERERLERRLLDSELGTLFRDYQAVESELDEASRKSLFFHTLALGISLGRLEV